MKDKQHPMKSNDTKGIKEIARLAGVSIGTVDRVLHNRKGVSDSTRTMVEAIVKDMNYHPNKMASLLASKKTLDFGVIIPDVNVNTDYWDYPKRGIELAAQELKQLGVRIEYFLFDLNDEASFIKASRKLISKKPDGVILAPSFIKESVKFVQRVLKREMAIIYINSDLPHHPGLGYIGPDFFQSGRVAAQLMKLYVQPEETLMVVNISSDMESEHHLLKKVQGFEHFFEMPECNKKIVTLHIPQTKVNGIEKIIKEALKLHKDCRSFFVTNSQVHILAKVLKRLRAKHFIIGYDFIQKNIGFMKEGDIDFLICHRPKDQGYHAVMSLYKYLYHGTVPDASFFMPIDIITKENLMFYNS